MDTEAERAQPVSGAGESRQQDGMGEAQVRPDEIGNTPQVLEGQNLQNERPRLPAPNRHKQRATKVLDAEGNPVDVSANYGQPPGYAWLYSDGSERGERGVMRKPIPGGRQWTRELAREASALGAVARVENRRERAIAGANAALAYAAKLAGHVRAKTDPSAPAQPVEDWERPTGLDFVEALAEAQMTQALLGSEAYRTQAGKLVLQMAGIAEDKQAQDAGGLAAGLIQLAQTLAERQAPSVDAEWTAQQADE